VTNLGASAYCESNTLSVTIQHTVTLGVYCSDLRPDDPYIFLDVYFECPESTTQFDFLGSETPGFNNTSGRYACSALLEFAKDSSTSSSKSISKVVITTDDYWRTNASDSCYTRISSAAPVPSSSIDSSTTATTVASALIGGVVGGIAAALVIGSLIGFFVLRRPADSSNVPKAAIHDDVAPLSIPAGTARHDSLLGPAPVAVAAHALPTAVPIAPSANNYTVDYKDQARTVQPEIPAAAVAEVVPFAAVALDTSVASGGSQKPTRPEPPGRVFLEL
jgi:hypothetical protein